MFAFSTPTVHFIFILTRSLYFQKVKEMWEIIKTMANIPALVRDEDPLKARGNPTIQQCLINQGKKYLEKRLVTKINT